ncbi:ABC transporter C-terminal domain-containing protein [Sediminitomix flava]|uniref:Receptor L domain-containing protein n=1 Tax=Sediminitomix flava TaxID=379075 RepID=A0A315Z921_SEDFL|nr:ABC transporter C-terminal domain-containing protein [Sediminitomix flava]PWJ40949.1 hypothetical protein BC781_104215 [Sediminitomix flava]
MRFKNYVIGAALLSLVACNTDELDQLRLDLEEQQQELTDLQGELEKLKESQEAAIAAAIASLEQQMADLEGESSAKLAELTQRLESEENAIFWGSLSTDEAYAKLTEDNLVVMGNVVVRSADDLAKLSNVQVVSGNLEVMYTDVTEVSIEGLVTVGGGLFVEGNSMLENLSLPMLLGVTGNIELVNNMSLTELSFASLGVAEKGVLIYNDLSQFDQANPVNENAGTFNFPKLKSIANDLFVQNSFVADFDAEMLEMIGGRLYFRENASLESVDFSALTEVSGIQKTMELEDIVGVNVEWGESLKGALVFDYNTSDNEAVLADFSFFNSLKTVDGDIYVNYPSVNNFNAFNALETVTYSGGGVGNGLGNVSPNFGIGLPGGSTDGSHNVTLMGFTDIASISGFAKAENFNKFDLNIGKLAAQGVLDVLPVLKKGHVRVKISNGNDFAYSSSLSINHFTELENGTFTVDSFNSSVVFTESEVFTKIMDIYDNPYTYNAIVDISIIRYVDTVSELSLCPFKTYVTPFENFSDWMKNMAFSYQFTDSSDDTASPIYGGGNMDDVLSDDTCN